MKKTIMLMAIFCVCALSVLGCYVNDKKVNDGGFMGEPDMVYIEDVCGVNMEFGATYVEGNSEWYWNKIYIRNTNIHGARIILFEGNTQIADWWVGWNASDCVNVRGEDGYMHTGCPYPTWLEINSHLEVYVTYWDANYQPVDCPKNGTVYDLDP